MKSALKIKTILKIFIIAIIIIFCAVSTANCKAFEKKIIIPKWFLNPPKDNNVIYAAGYAKKKNAQIAVISACDNARSEVSRVIQVKITTTTKQFLHASGVKDKTQASEFSQTVSRSLASNMLYFSKIEKQEIIKKEDGYIVFVLVGLNLEEMKNAVEGTLIDFSDEYNKLDTKNELDDLSKEIKEKISKQFKRTTIAQIEKEVKSKIEKDGKEEDVKISTGKEPAWVKSYPVLSNYYVGIGQGNTLEQAKDSAINTLVTQIEVSVKSEINDFMRETDGVTEEDVLVNIRLTVKDDIEDLELVGLWSFKSKYWAYYRLNIEKYKIRQQGKMDNAKRNALDFLEKSDNEIDPALKFKYAFLGYYIIGKYITRALKANYNGKEVIIVNELTRRMQKIMNGVFINTPDTNIEIDMINPTPIDIRLNISFNKRPVVNFPVKFVNNRGKLDISKKGVTDTNGDVKCIITKAISFDSMQSFSLQLDIASFIEDTAETEGIFINSAIIPPTADPL